MKHRVKINDIIIGLSSKNDIIIIYVKNEDYDLITTYPYNVYATKFDHKLEDCIEIKPISVSHPGHKELIESVLSVNITRGIDFYLYGELEHITYLKMGL